MVLLVLSAVVSTDGALAGQAGAPDVAADASAVPDLRPPLAPPPGIEVASADEASSQTIGEGPILTWTKVELDEGPPRPPGSRPVNRTTTPLAWLGDRFVRVDEDTRTVSTSTDGVSWDTRGPGDPDPGYDELMLMDAVASWQDIVVGWDPEAPGPGTVRIVRAPDGPVATSDFEGQVGAVGIGPAGIVVRTHSALDFDAFVTSLLGSGWVEHMVSFAFEDGILRITTDDDRALEVVWAEHGLEPGDVADRGFGWYSADGEEWTPIPDFPANVDDVVGVSDGFIVRGYEGRCDGCGESADPWGMWHSPDGLTWRPIGPATEGDLLPWMGAVLVSDGTGFFDVWTSEGVRALPMAAEMPARSTNPASIGVGPLGLVSLRYGDRKILYSPDGVEWSIVPMPEAMAEDGGGRRAASVAVGERSVLVLSWSRDEIPVPSLWLGSAEPRVDT
jgi:hypothetical protein